MEQIAITPDSLKLALKEALVEVFTEQRELLSTIVLEVLEDIALTEAMTEGLESEEVSREEVFRVLKEMQDES
jgi:hypothetical protein